MLRPSYVITSKPGGAPQHLQHWSKQGVTYNLNFLHFFTCDVCRVASFPDLQSGLADWEWESCLIWLWLPNTPIYIKWWNNIYSHAVSCSELSGQKVIENTAMITMQADKLTMTNRMIQNYLTLVILIYLFLGIIITIIDLLTQTFEHYLDIHFIWHQILSRGPTQW